MFDVSRRGFLAGILAAACAPVILRAESLMPVKAALLTDTTEIMEVFDDLPANPVPAGALYNELTEVTRRAFVPRWIVEMYYATPTLKALLDKNQTTNNRLIFQNAS